LIDPLGEIEVLLILFNNTSIKLIYVYGY